MRAKLATGIIARLPSFKFTYPKCYGSTTVSKTVSVGSTPTGYAKTTYIRTKPMEKLEPLPPHLQKVIDERRTFEKKHGFESFEKEMISIIESQKEVMNNNPFHPLHAMVGVGN